MRKMRADRIHDGLDEAGCIGRSGVTVYPPLRMHDVADGVIGAADWNA